MIGSFTGRALPIEDVDDAWGHAKTGMLFVRLACQITKGEHAGKTYTWKGYFGPDSAERTKQSLEHCGADLSTGRELKGVDRNEVNLVLKEEKNEETGKVYTKISFINRIGGMGKLPDSAKLAPHQMNEVDVMLRASSSKQTSTEVEYDEEAPF
jgi:hypothetical protein